MQALLVYPEHQPRTYWSFSGALPYIGRRAAFPPLGLITLAALLPRHWDIRLVDMNVAPLRDADLLWADVVMTSTMVVQAASLAEVVARCNRLGVPVAAGGPHPSIAPDSMTGVDHVFVGEAEGAIDAFAADLERGCAQPLYRAEGVPEVDDSPVPRFDLLDPGAYASMAVQHSRGCPFSCEFCDIWKLYGRRHRVKSPERMTAELDALYATGWRGSVFFVDDNFIGNRRLAARSLAALERWQRDHGFPFDFFTEASVNLGSDDELMRGMRNAGFSFVFLGIETPSVESLAGANKPVNVRLDLLDTVRRIQSHGIEVSSGFIVGFDEDPDDIFDRQIEFIRQAGIPVAMIGILTALRGTDLYDRLAREGRLLGESFGNNTHDFEANFVTRMPPDRLAAGYRRVLGTLYDPTLANYFERCRRLFDRLGPRSPVTHTFGASDVRAVVRSLWTVVSRRYGPRYLRFVLWCARHHPARLADAITLAIKGFHFEGITREALACHSIRDDALRIAERCRRRVAEFAADVRRRRELETARVRGLIAEQRRGRAAHRAAGVDGRGGGAGGRLGLSSAELGAAGVRGRDALSDERRGLSSAERGDAGVRGRDAFAAGRRGLSDAERGDADVRGRNAFAAERRGLSDAEFRRDRAARGAAGVRGRDADEPAYIRLLIAERARLLRGLRRRIRRLAPDARAMALSAYDDALARVNAVVAEHAPATARAFESGARRLANLRESIRRDADRIAAGAADARRRAARGLADLRHELRALDRQRRAALRRARARVRELPAEYRVVGHAELRALRRRLADLAGEPA